MYDIELVESHNKIYVRKRKTVILSWQGFSTYNYEESYSRRM